MTQQANTPMALPAPLPEGVPARRNKGAIPEGDLSVHALAEQAQRILSRRRLLPFIKRNVPGYDANWYHKVLCQALEEFSAQVADGVSCPRLIIMAPPRSGKSEIISRNFPAWHLGRYPDDEIISCSYGSELAKDFSKKVRNLIRDDSYTVLFPDVELDPTSQAADRWVLDGYGGGYVAAGVGGPITGRGMRVGIIDDYFKNDKDADSESGRENLWSWYKTTFLTRQAPGAGIIIMATRWHEDDLIGKVLEKEGRIEDGGKWKVLEFQAEALEDEQYRKKGEALHPARYDNGYYDQFRDDARTWWALFQQKPMVEDGDYFKSEDFKYYHPKDRPPLHELTIWATVDLAVATSEKSDRTPPVIFGIDFAHNIWILQIDILRLDSFDLVERFFDLHRAWKVRLWIFEHGQISLSIGPFLDARIRDEKQWDFDWETIKPGKVDKQGRAQSFRGRMKQGKVFFPHPDLCPWMKETRDELLKFPNGKHDDIVDSLAYIGLSLDKFFARLPQQKKTKGKSWRDKLVKHLAGGQNRSRTSMGA